MASLRSTNAALSIRKVEKVMNAIGDNDAKWDENFDFDVWLKRYGPPISRDTQTVSGATNGKTLKEPDHGYVEGSSEWKRTVNCVRYGDATKEKNALLLSRGCLAGSEEMQTFEE